MWITSDWKICTKEVYFHFNSSLTQYLWNRGQTSSEVQNRGNSDPTKNDWCPQFILKQKLHTEFKLDIKCANEWNVELGAGWGYSIAVRGVWLPYMVVMSVWGMKGWSLGTIARWYHTLTGLNDVPMSVPWLYPRVPLDLTLPPHTPTKWVGKAPYCYTPFCYCSRG